MNEEQKTEILSLITKASRSHNALEALQWTQAACNAANALCSLATAMTIGKQPPSGQADA